MVKGGSSPDDPGLAQYWADRRRKGAPPPLDQLSLRLLKMQAGRCPCCGDLLLHADHPPQTPTQWEQWVRVTGKALRKQSLVYRKRDGSDETRSLRLVHAKCRGNQYAVASA
jgi:RNA-directed DNA polymerase